MTLAETGNLTRIEAGLMYSELRRQEMRNAAQTALFLLPAFQAAGMLAAGSKRGAEKAADAFKKIKRDLEKLYGERE